MKSIAGLQQVQLRVRVAEVSRNALQALNVNAFWNQGQFFGGNQLGSSAGPFTQMSGGIPDGSPLGPGRVPFQVTEGNISVPPTAQLFAGFPNSDLEIFINALAENQYLRTLAEPTLIAASGQSATFLAGGEVPIPISDVQGGNTQISIEYREYGIRLAFKPFVLGAGTIRLSVTPEVSELTDVGAITVLGSRIPALRTRRVNSTFEMQSGQTFAIAGLIERSTNAQNSRIPGLGDLPVLGALFRSVRYQTSETELMVLVTASLVEPQSARIEDVPYPGMTHKKPGPWRFYVEGQLEAKHPRTLTPAQQDRLENLGLNKLNGPGAWASYETTDQVGDDAAK
jgi:pilus assembly protein CpaC